MSAEAAKFGAVAVAAAAPGAVAMSVEAAEAVEIVEATEAERAFAQLEHLYAQLPAMEEKGAALARARSAAEVDGLAKAAAYRAALLRSVRPFCSFGIAGFGGTYVATFPEASESPTSPLSPMLS